MREAASEGQPKMAFSRSARWTAVAISFIVLGPIFFLSLENSRWSRESAGAPLSLKIVVSSLSNQIESSWASMALDSATASQSASTAAAAATGGAAGRGEEGSEAGAEGVRDIAPQLAGSSEAEAPGKDEMGERRAGQEQVLGQQASRQGSAVAEPGAGEAGGGIGVALAASGSQEDPSCSIYVMDASTELAPLVNVPACDIDDKRFWPHDQPGKGIDGMNQTAHYAAQHASIYWIAKAIRASKYAEKDIDSADIVFLDNHCYTIRITAFLQNDGGHKVAGQYDELMVRALPQHPRFKASNGSLFAVGAPFPGPHVADLSGQVCGAYRPSYVLGVQKAGAFCKDDQKKALEGRGLIVPYPAVEHIPEQVSFDHRPLFLFSRNGCPGNVKVFTRMSSGKLLRRALLVALNGSAPDVEVGCSCSICPTHMAHDEMMKKLESTVFCPVVAGDTQSSRRLTEVVLAGCIPLFIGPPFHTLPMAADVDYTTFSVFVNMTDVSDWVFLSEKPYDGPVHLTNTRPVLEWWSLDADIPPDKMLRAATFQDMMAQLRALPHERVRALQEALALERGKFMFAPPPGQEGTPLTDAVMRRMCEHARRARARDVGAAGGTRVDSGQSSLSLL